MHDVVSKLPLLMLLSIGALLSACSGQGEALKKKGKSLTPMQQLAAMNWKLTGLKRGLNPPGKRFASGVPLSRYHLNFNKGNMQLSGGCNLINGAAKVTAPGRLLIGPLMMTNRGCSTRLMQADVQIGKTLGRVSHFRLKQRQLALLGAKKILLFEGSPKPETLYGGKGVRKFIEVRNAPAGLQWREAKYDSNWVRIDTDTSWTKGDFPGIKGFTPQQNYEYIIRIREFRDPNNGKAIWFKDLVTSQSLLQ